MASNEDLISRNEGYHTRTPWSIDIAIDTCKIQRVILEPTVTAIASDRIVIIANPTDTRTCPLAFQVRWPTFAGEVDSDSAAFGDAFTNPRFRRIAVMTCNQQFGCRNKCDDAWASRLFRISESASEIHCFVLVPIVTSSIVNWRAPISYPIDATACPNAFQLCGTTLAGHIHNNCIIFAHASALEKTSWIAIVTSYNNICCRSECDDTRATDAIYFSISSSEVYCNTLRPIVTAITISTIGAVSQPMNPCACPSAFQASWPSCA
mmetsp:Transcript_16098/g.25571  ORF Transcript_16098/g.25571 Transcript_16098/m.25571 type:complete len:265 (+) Transcript_16098:379-1173(+)